MRRGASALLNIATAPVITSELGKSTRTGCITRSLLHLMAVATGGGCSCAEQRPFPRCQVAARTAFSWYRVLLRESPCYRNRSALQYL